MSRAELAAEALRIVDREGPAALTTERLARTLGIPEVDLGAGDVLLDLVVEAALGEELPTVDEQAAWQERLTQLAGWYRGLLLRHPNALGILSTRPVATPGSFRVVERWLAALTGGGLQPAEALAALGVVVSFTVGHVLSEVSAPDQPPPEPPAGEFQLLHTAVAQTTWGLPDGQFLFGVEAVVHGLEVIFSQP